MRGGIEKIKTSPSTAWVLLESNVIPPRGGGGCTGGGHATLSTAACTAAATVASAKSLATENPVCAPTIGGWTGRAATAGGGTTAGGEGYAATDGYGLLPI